MKRNGISTIKTLVLTIIAIIYLAGGYGLVTNMLPVAPVWAVVIASSAYSAAFLGVGYWLYRDSD